MRWQCTWHSGPDCGGRTTLGPGAHLVGRAPSAAVRCDDPLLATHHLLLHTEDHGVRVTRLVGAAPVVTARADGGADVAVGGSVLRLQPAAAGPPDAPTAGVRDDGTVVRAARAVPRWNPAQLPELPPPPPDDEHGQGTLLPALLGLLGAALVAVVLRQPMFAVFGAVGAIVAVGSWATQRVATRRRRTRATAARDAALRARAAALESDAVAHRAHVEQLTPTPATAREAAGHRRGLWGRRPDHGDAHVVAVGRGAVAWRDDAAALDDLPIAAGLGTGARLAVSGPHAGAVARSMVAQLVTECGPADLRVVVVTDRPDRWRCWTGLPHLRTADGQPGTLPAADLPDALAALAAASGAAVGVPHVVIVTDDDAALTVRTGPLRRALAAHPDAALVAVLTDGRAPQWCTAALVTHGDGWADWSPDTRRASNAAAIRLLGLGETSSTAITRSLDGLRDPEDTLDAGRLPDDVHLARLLADDPDGSEVITAEVVRRRWARHGAAPPCTPIGVAADGVVDIDLGRDGPHGLLAGTTGSGKSELLRSLVAGLAATVHPSHLQMVLVDYKGGATFDDLARLPHVTGMVTDLDDALAERALRSLHAELRRRESVLRDAGVADLDALLRRGGSLPRLLVLVDEFAALVAEQPDFLHALLGVAQRGRSLGVHLMLATQRPHGIVSDDIRANTNLRVALRLHDVADAVDVVGDSRPATLSRRTPGRAVMRLGADEHVVFQTARVLDVDALVAAVAKAADGMPPQAPPWMPPLPATLARGEVPDGALGWCDDPDHQRRVALHWSARDGGVLVVGGPGSGVTCTLRTLAAQAVRDGHPVHVVDAVSDPAWDALAAHPGVALATIDRPERVARLLHRLTHPTTGNDARSGERAAVVVVDGVEAVRRALDEAGSVTDHDRLDAVLAGHQHVLLIGTSQPTAVPAAAAARCAHRWLLHLTDAHERAVLGVTATGWPAEPLPGRLVVASTGRWAQIVEPALPEMPVTVRLAPIDPVPPWIPATTLPCPGPVTPWREGDDERLAIGLDVASGDAAVLSVPEGEHVLVLGGPRTGRSTALTRLATAWRAAHPDGTVVAVLPRRSAFDRTLAHLVHRNTADLDERLLDGRCGPALIVVDDADAVDDDGRLARAIAAHHPGILVMAAARGDALRQRYGHWTAGIRHSHLGLVAAAHADHDGDLLSVVLPRRSPVAPRPGLMWCVSTDGAALVQVAVDGSGQRGPAAAQRASASAAADATSSSERPA
ncbi:MAG: FtsK/SpoIIIE domain-containing protein [Ilumatobacteraceae bacterium]